MSALAIRIATGLSAIRTAAQAVARAVRITSTGDRRVTSTGDIRIKG